MPHVTAQALWAANFMVVVPIGQRLVAGLGKNPLEFKLKMYMWNLVCTTKWLPSIFPLRPAELPPNTLYLCPDSVNVAP